MPNYCWNTLLVKGNKKQIADFKSKVFKPFEVIIAKKDIKKLYEEKILLETPLAVGDLREYVRIHKLTPLKYLKEKMYLQENDKGDLGNAEIEFTFDILCHCPDELNGNDVHSWGGENAKENDRKRAELKKKYGQENAYNWHVANWGTKWDTMDSSLNYETEFARKDEVSYSFTTAYSPPAMWLIQVAPMYPKLKFELDYEQEGETFTGTITAKNDSFKNVTKEYERCPKCGYCITNEDGCDNEDCEDSIYNFEEEE